MISRILDRRNFRGAYLNVDSAVLLYTFGLCLQQPAFAQKAGKGKEPSATPVLWRDPGNITSRDLRYGPGSPEVAPVAPFTFVEESKSGESPKFDVRDARGTLWSVKLGEEARAETVSTRLLWAVGYFAEEAYYFDEVRIENLPRLSRGRVHVAGSLVHGARFEPKREDMKGGPTWGWHKNQFEDTRELSGLKVLMILLNNFDAREANNRVFYADAPEGSGREARHYVTDLGATLGRAGGFGGKRTKNNLEDFLSTKFIRGVDNCVSSSTTTRAPRGFGHCPSSAVYYRAR